MKTATKNIKPTAKVDPKKRKMGFWARSVLKPHLVEALNHHGLNIRVEDENTYHLFSTQPSRHPRDILPSFIEAIEDTDSGLKIDLPTLETALEFMHQPVRVTMRHNATQKHEAAAQQLFNQAAHMSKITNTIDLPSILEMRARINTDRNNQDHRVKAQNIFRFLTTASTSIPVVQGEFNEIDACHADEENEMRDKDAWALNNEIGHSDHPMQFDQNKPPENKVKTIPDFYFDPARGYVIKIHPALLNTGALNGESQNRLKEKLLETINNLGTPTLRGKTHSQIQSTQEITLTPDQFAELCTFIYNAEEIAPLLDAVKTEETEQARDLRMAAKNAILKQNDDFLTLSQHNKKSSDDIRNALTQILEATTQLTPIVTGKHLQKSWNHFHPSKKTDMPFDDVLDDYIDMRHKIEQMLDQKEITHAQLESFAQEYYKILAFTAQTADILNTAAQDQNTKSVAARTGDIATGALATSLASLFIDTGGADMNLLNVIAYGLTIRSGLKTGNQILDATLPNRKDMDHDLRHQTQTKMQNIGTAIQNVSLTGIHIEDEFLEDHHQNTLSVLRKTLKQDGSFAEQSVDALKESGKEFFDDLIGSFKESRVTQLSTAGIAGLLIWNSLKSDPSAVSQITTPPPEPTGLGLDTLEYEDVSTINIPKPEDIAFSCHTDVKYTPQGLFQAYKHCIFGTMVEDQASNIVSGTDFVLQKKIFDNRAIELINNITQDRFGISIDGNDESIFTKYARAAVKPTSYILMIVNWLQNITHAALWSFSANKGWNIGFHGYKESFSFVKPFYDIAHRAVRVPFTAMSSALQSVGINIPALPDPPRSIHDNLYQFLIESDPLANKTNFSIINLEDTLGITNDIDDINTLQDNVIAQWPENLKPANIKMKIGGFKEQFELSEQNLTPVMQAIAELDLTITTFSEQINASQPWYHAMVRTHLDAMNTALKKYLENGNAEFLKDGLKNNLEFLSGFELRQSGQSKIFNAFTGGDPNDKTQSVLLREANAAFGKQSRLMNRIQHALFLTGQKENTKPTIGKLAQTSIHLSFNNAWDKTVNTMRNTQRGAQYIGNRPLLNYGLKGSAGLLIGADVAGILPENTIAEALTAALGTTYGITATGTSFAIFNSGEDVILIHTTMMSVLITGGAVSAIAYNKAAAPSAMASAEALREKWPKLDILDGSQKLSKGAQDTLQNLSQHITDTSEDLAPGIQNHFKNHITIPQSDYTQTPSPNI